MTESNCIEDGMDTDLRKPFQVGYEAIASQRSARKKKNMQQQQQENRQRQEENVKSSHGTIIILASIYRVY